MRHTFLFAATLFAASLAGAPAVAKPVLLISIDGLRPGDVLEAEQRGLKLPNLRRFVKEGAYATGVVGVLPTVTYASHTTLITGVSPAKHGVLSNTTFDPLLINQDGWYWYASDIKVPTLWQAASKAGMTVGSVHWPVSVGATGINWNLAQYWRTGHADDAKLIDALSTPGLVSELERATGEIYAPGIDSGIEADENRGRFAIKLIEAHKPEFLTVYLAALDHAEHVTGPGSPEAHAFLERSDAIVGKLLAAERVAHPDAVTAVVSDHGFEAISHETSLYRPFIDAGLITLDEKGAIKSWEAMPWIAGGSAAIILSRPGDTALQAKVAKVLDDLKADPANGVAAVIGKDEIAKMGGNPQATFYVSMAPDTTIASFAGADGPLRGPSEKKGMHGYFPQGRNLRSTFMIMGNGVPAGRSLGEIDMRAIAPTLASELDVPFPTAELPALQLSKKQAD